MAGLSDKQKQFVAEYLVDMNATQAAIRAGYSPKTAKLTGHRLITNDNVAAAVAEAKSERLQRVQVNQDYVLDTIVDTIERCKQAKPVYDRKGNHVLVETPNGEMAPAYTFDAGNVLRGAEMLGKHLGIMDKSQEEQTDRLTLALIEISKQGSAAPIATARKREQE